MCTAHEAEDKRDAYFLTCTTRTKTKDNLESNIRKLPGLSKFHFKTEENSCGRFFESSQPCMLKGVECDTILSSLGSVLINTGADAIVEAIWKIWSDIIADIKITSKEMQQKEPRKHEHKDILYSKEVQLKWIFSRIKTFLLLLGKKYPDSICKSHYLHILGCHVVDFLERYDCLIKYSNQGFENSH